MGIKEGTIERYLEALLVGNRQQCRAIIEETLQSGVTASTVYAEVIWPIMSEIERLSRSDTISPAQEHLITRINRTIVDQLQNKLPRREGRNKKLVVCCAPEEIHELGAQMTADLFESDGWEVKFLGGGLTNEDILTFVHAESPEMLLIYGTAPAQAPSIRKLIDTIRDINAWSKMRIMVSGGLFNRAEGLWQEIGADMFAATAPEAVKTAIEPVTARPQDRTINRRKACRKTCSPASSSHP